MDREALGELLPKIKHCDLDAQRGGFNRRGWESLRLLIKRRL
jgi:hypothetical protein